jgi:hypothetical protein
MKRLILSILATAAIAAAAPAFAQGPRPVDWQPLSERRESIDRRIELSQASGALTELQARDLRDQFKGLLNLEAEYRKTGLTYNQRVDLQARYDTLSSRLRADTATEPLYYPAGHEGGQ